jgi:hypothetical protein
MWCILKQKKDLTNGNIIGYLNLPKFEEDSSKDKIAFMEEVNHFC